MSPSVLWVGVRTLDSRFGTPIFTNARYVRDLLTWRFSHKATTRAITCKITVVGLTGGIATGKSTVSSILKARGYLTIDADVLAREAVLPHTPAHTAIVKAFGEDILQSDGCLDRKKLGSAIFNDEGKRKRLNGIVHPAVRRAMVWGVVKAWIRVEKVCIVDVPLLIETGIWKWVGKVVVVYT